jgi:hypothetical protein
MFDLTPIVAIILMNFVSTALHQVLTSSRVF